MIHLNTAQLRFQRVAQTEADTLMSSDGMNRNGAAVMAAQSYPPSRLMNEVSVIDMINFTEFFHDFAPKIQPVVSVTTAGEIFLSSDDSTGEVEISFFNGKCSLFADDGVVWIEEDDIEIQDISVEFKDCLRKVIH
jgi:hypothetical protein